MNLSIDVARRILEASKQRAREMRSPVSIAIVDSGGHLVLFERMMSPYGWATGNISIAKASTAVMFNQSTDAIAQWGAGIPGFASSMAEMSHGKFIMAAGGWPIRVGGATVGGIGVSGGNAPGRDDEIARAGLGAVEALAPAMPAQPPMAQVPQPVVPLQSQSQPQMQQQHSRPYMQPTPSYPSMPPANNPSLPLANSGVGPQNAFGSGQSETSGQNEQQSVQASSFQNALVNSPQSSFSSSEQNAQSSSRDVPPSTQHLLEQLPQEENPYNDQTYSDQTYTQFNNSNRSGGQ